ncbi:hypothetical protein THAOC_19216, partial [Thalassiosira oceanica]
ISALKRLKRECSPPSMTPIIALAKVFLILSDHIARGQDTRAVFGATAGSILLDARPSALYSTRRRVHWVGPWTGLRRPQTTIDASSVVDLSAPMCSRPSHHEQFFRRGGAARFAMMSSVETAETGFNDSVGRSVALDTSYPWLTQIPTLLCCLGQTEELRPVQPGWLAEEELHEHMWPPQLPSQYPNIHLRFRSSSSLADPESNAIMLTWTPSRQGRNIMSTIAALDTAPVLTAVSDGSVDPVTGAAGYSWIIAAPEKAGYMTDAEPIYSDPRTMASYRAELHGIYKLLFSLKTNYRTRRIELWCDSESAIDLLNNPTELTPEELTKAEGDLLTAIKRLLRQFPTITLKHVRGHQLKHTRRANLSFEAQLNEDCDSAAKTAMRASAPPTTRPDPIAGSRAQLYLNNLLVSTDYKSAISCAAHYPELRDRMMDHFDWTAADFNSINFDAIEAVKQKLPYNQSLQISKMLHHYSNTGKWRRKYGEEGGCPSCDEEIETQLHLYRCTGPAMRDALTTGLQQMEESLLSKHIPNTVVRHFMHEVRKTCQLPTIEHDVPCSLCSQAVAAQANLGEESLLMGYLVKEWTNAIAQHYRPPPKPTNDPSAKPAPHPSHLSTILVDELWKLWLHIWCTRTNILLDGDNRVASAEDARITARLLHFKQHHTTMLREL